MAVIPSLPRDLLETEDARDKEILRLNFVSLRMTNLVDFAKFFPTHYSNLNP